MKSFETCLPVYRAANTLKKKHQVSALFPGYVFCRFNRTELMPIITVPWVIDIVSRGRVPVPIDEDEMRGIRLLADSGLASEPCTYLSVGERVEVTEGPLEGVEGILIREKGHQRLVVSVSLLLRSVSVEVPSNWVKPVVMRRPPTGSHGFRCCG
jgi:transcriptional antiterminator NusG